MSYCYTDVQPHPPKGWVWTCCSPGHVHVSLAAGCGCVNAPGPCGRSVEISEPQSSSSGGGGGSGSGGVSSHHLTGKLLFCCLPSSRGSWLLLPVW
jgi:hypothetical protein